MNKLVLDVEATIHDDGNPYSDFNKLCCIGLYSPDLGKRTCIPIEYGNSPYGEALTTIKELIEAADLLIGFNIKYDINWIRKYIPDIQLPAVFDCQLAEFILNAQRTPYPSLSDCAIKYGVGDKLATVLDEYWSKGIDTTNIPWDILSTYNLNDLEITYKVYEKQVNSLQGNLLRLFELQCEDLKILSEMEHNGLLIDLEKIKIRSEELDVKIKELYQQLNAIVGRDDINWDSPSQLSAVLYGGEISFPCKETVTKILKSGKIKTYDRMATNTVTFMPRLEPLADTETARTRNFADEEALRRENLARASLGKTKLRRCWETNEPTLRALRPTTEDGRSLIRHLLTLSEYSQLQSTYYKGLIKRISGLRTSSLDSVRRCIIHGQFNQCVAVTGRLSSSKPNLQNLADDILESIKTRYVD